LAEAKVFSCLASGGLARCLGAQMNAADVNLYLVGFMGTGKSTVGRLVARRIGFKQIDSDHEIEHLQGRSIAEIFAAEGEAAFRGMERAFIENGHPAERTVIACGGGLVVQPGMLEQLRSKGVVICLHASLETVLERTQRHRNRPLLEVDDPMARIRELYAEREPVYRRAGSLILTDARPLNDIVAHVLRTWRREAADFARVHRSSV
jgi:shikimate kinase